MLACCLLLEHLPDPSTKGSTKGGRPKVAPPLLRRPKAFLPLWMGLAGVQASSSKQQASIRHQAASIKHQASSIKNQSSSIRFVTNQHTTEVEALLTRQISIIVRHASFSNFEISRFPDFQMFNFENVEFGRFGIINPVQNLLVSIRTVFRSLQNH